MGQAVQGTYVYEWPKPDVTVDCVVFAYAEGLLRVLLIRRGGEPFAGSWALPGGFRNPGEVLADAARRELLEETGLAVPHLEQLKTFGDPGRDPRGDVVTVAHWALVRPSAVAGGDDATDAVWQPVEGLDDAALAFDHAEIIRVALGRLRGQVRYQPVGFGLMPEEFTLGDLQRMYESLLGRPLSKTSFRRKLKAMGVLVATGGRLQGPHRPSALYRFDPERYDALVARGIDFDL